MANTVPEYLIRAYTRVVPLAELSAGDILTVSVGGYAMLDADSVQPGERLYVSAVCRGWITLTSERQSGWVWDEVSTRKVRSSRRGHVRRVDDGWVSILGSRYTPTVEAVAGIEGSRVWAVDTSTVLDGRANLGTHAEYVQAGFDGMARAGVVVQWMGGTVHLVAAPPAVVGTALEAVGWMARDHGATVTDGMPVPAEPAAVEPTPVASGDAATPGAEPEPEPVAVPEPEPEPEVSAPDAPDGALVVQAALFGDVIVSMPAGPARDRLVKAIAAPLPARTRRDTISTADLADLAEAMGDAQGAAMLRVSAAVGRWSEGQRDARTLAGVCRPIPAGVRGPAIGQLQPTALTLPIDKLQPGDRAMLPGATEWATVQGVRALSRKTLVDTAAGLVEVDSESRRDGRELRYGAPRVFTCRGEGPAPQTGRPWTDLVQRANERRKSAGMIREAAYVGKLGSKAYTGSGERVSRGDLLLVVEDHDGTRVTVGVVTSVTRGGAVKAYRPAGADSPRQTVHGYSWTRYHVVRAQAVDVDAALAAAAAHPWHNGSPGKPYGSVDEVLAMLRSLDATSSDRGKTSGSDHAAPVPPADVEPATAAPAPPVSDAPETEPAAEPASTVAEPADWTEVEEVVTAVRARITVDSLALRVNRVRVFKTSGVWQIIASDSAGTIVLAGTCRWRAGRRVAATLALSPAATVRVNGSAPAVVKPAAAVPAGTRAQAVRPAQAGPSVSEVPAGWVGEVARLTTADTAKLVRAALRSAFPGVRFSVRSDSYSGGSSIDVSWTDGPLTRTVEKVTKSFAGARFDGMADMKTYRSAVLVTDGSGARAVNLGADFVMCHRTVSAERLEAMRGEAARMFGQPVEDGRWYRAGEYAHPGAGCGGTAVAVRMRCGGWPSGSTLTGTPRSGRSIPPQQPEETAAAQRQGGGAAWYAVTGKGGGVLHYVTGDLGAARPFAPVDTWCGRVVTPSNYFADLDDYRQSYNVNGRLCFGCGGDRPVAGDEPDDRVATAASSAEPVTAPPAAADAVTAETPVVSDAEPVRVADLTGGEHVHIVGVDQYGSPTHSSGYVQGAPGPVTVKGRTAGGRPSKDPKKARPGLLVSLTEHANGWNGWRMTVVTTTDAVAEPVTDAVHQFRPAASDLAHLVHGRCSCGGYETSGASPYVSERAGWLRHANPQPTPADVREIPSSVLDRAEELGGQAYADGLSSAPGSDPEIRAMVDGWPVGTGAVRVFQAFTRGYQDAADREAERVAYAAEVSAQHAASAAEVAERNPAAAEAAGIAARGAESAARTARRVAAEAAACRTGDGDAPAVGDAQGAGSPPMYGAPADWYAPELDSDDDAPMSITHTHEDGTRFEGGRNGDGTLEILQAHRFVWRRGPGVHIPHSRDRFADLDAIGKAAVALREAGHRVRVDVDDVWRPAEQREEHRAERVAYRAARLAERAGRQAEVSATRREAGRRIGDGIPFGQPVLADHYSAPRHLRALARMEAHRRAAADAYDYARSLADRSTAAERNEAAKHNPRAIMRRVEMMEADARRWERELAELAASGRPAPRHLRRCTLELEKVREDIAYQRAKLAALGESGEFVAWSAEHFRRGDWANVGGRWCEVARVNAKSLSVRARFEWMDREQTGRVSWDEVHGRRRDGLQWDTPNGQPWPVEQAKRVARWLRLDRSAGVTGVAERQRWNVERARRIARGLLVTATDAELAAFPTPDGVHGVRALALLSLDIYERLTAGELVSDVAASTTPFDGPAPAWRMPDGPTVDRRVDQLTPGDIVAGYYDSGVGRRLVRGFCGPVASVGPMRDRRESGRWHTVTLTTGESHDFQTHVWFAVHPVADDVAA